MNRFYNDNRMTKSIGLESGDANSLRNVLDFATDRYPHCTATFKDFGDVHTCICAKLEDHVPESHTCRFCCKEWRNNE